MDVLLLGVILGLRRRGEPLLGKTPLNTLLFIYIGFTYLSMIPGVPFFLGIGLPLWFDDSRVSDWKNYVVDLSLMFFVVRSAIQTKRQMGILMCGMSIGVLLLAKNFHSSISGRDFSSFSYSLSRLRRHGMGRRERTGGFDGPGCCLLSGLLPGRTALSQ